ncbi:MAG: DUF389 domain-containing protein [Saprospirales bacterium]|nr:DUF389 domain-containing protein [Saprospirales bacterium]
MRSNMRMQGANAWLLMCSIMVASLGLDLNSPAVIIGAMLISPLMSPILGLGLSVSINDREMLGTSLRHFGISIAIALATSYLYFSLTPFGEITSEIQARTAPTFLDVLVAFFGGIAGIISMTRRDASNAIPGVAIATALMPPLCVTGFGLATGEWEIMLNSFYLFFLNAVFVGVATYLIVRVLNFPFKAYPDVKEKRRTRLYLFLFSLVIIIPSFFILYDVLDLLHDKARVQTYLEAHFPEAIWEIQEDKQTDSLDVRLFIFEKDKVDSLDILVQEFEALNCRAIFRPIAADMAMSDLEIEELKQTMQREFMDIFETDQKIQSEKDKQIKALTEKIALMTSDSTLFINAMREAQVLFPDIKELSFGRTQQAKEDTVYHYVPTLMVQWKQEVSLRLPKTLRKRGWRALPDCGPVGYGGVDPVVTVFSWQAGRWAVGSWQLAVNCILHTAN